MKYWIIAFVLIGVSLFMLLRYLVIPSFIFHPAKELTATPSVMGLAYEDVQLKTTDGESIAGWYIPAEANLSGLDKGYTLLFFHGNAGNISHRLESIAFFHKLGLSVFIIDYRGFGESSGRPSVDGTVQDALAAWQWLTEYKKTPASRVILFGRSLGGGVAAALATKVSPRALILESTFTSLRDVGEEIIPWLPSSLLSDDYTTLNNLNDLNVPLLVVHSPSDEVINFTMGRAIFDSYNGPKYFLQIHGSHNGGWFTDIVTYEQGMHDFLETLPDK